MQLELAKHVKDGCKEEGLVGLIFNTIGVSDAITMGTDGTSYLSPHNAQEILIGNTQRRDEILVRPSQP